jgi:hypothetical protein
MTAKNTLSWLVFRFSCPPWPDVRRRCGQPAARRVRGSNAVEEVNTHAEAPSGRVDRVRPGVIPVGHREIRKRRLTHDRVMR